MAVTREEDERGQIFCARVMQNFFAVKTHAKDRAGRPPPRRGASLKIDSQCTRTLVGCEWCTETHPYLENHWFPRLPKMPFKSWRRCRSAPANGEGGKCLFDKTTKNAHTARLTFRRRQRGVDRRSAQSFAVVLEAYNPSSTHKLEMTTFFIPSRWSP